jgi:hypothetical protein
LLNTLSETPRPTVNDTSNQHIAFELWLIEGKGQFHLFYWQKYRLIIPAGQSVVIWIAVGMDRDPFWTWSFAGARRAAVVECL